LQRFLLEYFPEGIEASLAQDMTEPTELPPAPVEAFSIDDVTTTEIDDAFSVRALPAGGWEIGVHIAAPALAIPPGSPLDVTASSRLSTVYMPGGKITMLPGAVIERYTLSEGRVVPAVSLYLELGPDLRLLATRSVVEKVRVVANLRHDALEEQFNEESLAAGRQDFPFAAELKLLWDLAGVLEAGRGRQDNQRTLNMDYSF
jgi:exoribonuclease-2